MPGAISRIEGMGPALATLRKLDEHVQEKVGKIALAAASGKLAARVKARAKVSSRPNDPTRGSLQESVKDKAGRKKRGMATRAVIADDVAAAPKEFGLSRKNYPAEPWFRPAVDAGRQEAGEALAEAIKQEVEGEKWR